LKKKKRRGKKRGMFGCLQNSESLFSKYPAAAIEEKRKRKREEGGGKPRLEGKKEKGKEKDAHGKDCRVS